jgi:hypothetical protein
VTISVPPYHSTYPGDPEVHHVFDDCPEGMEIPSYNRASGTHEWPLCGSCERMGG